MRKALRLSIAGVLLATASALALDAGDALDDPQQQALYDRLVKEVRCLVCQNQTIGDSTAPLALDLRREIRMQIEAGSTEAEIKTFLTTRYGDFVLYRPRFGGPAALLWILPGLLLLVGIIVLRNIVSRRSTLPITTDAEDAFDPDTGSRPS